MIEVVPTVRCKRDVKIPIPQNSATNYSMKSEQIYHIWRHKMRKRDKACFILGTILIIGAVVLMVFTFSKRNNTDDRPVSTVIYHDDGRGMPIFERR